MIAKFRRTWQSKVERENLGTYAFRALRFRARNALPAIPKKASGAGSDTAFSSPARSIKCVGFGLINIPAVFWLEGLPSAASNTTKSGANLWRIGFCVTRERNNGWIAERSSPHPFEKRKCDHCCRIESNSAHALTHHSALLVSKPVEFLLASKLSNQSRLGCQAHRGSVQDAQANPNHHPPRRRSHQPKSHLC